METNYEIYVIVADTDDPEYYHDEESCGYYIGLENAIKEAKSISTDKRNGYVKAVYVYKAYIYEDGLIMDPRFSPARTDLAAYEVYHWEREECSK